MLLGTDPVVTTAEVDKAENWFWKHEKISSHDPKKHETVGLSDA